MNDPLLVLFERLAGFKDPVAGETAHEGEPIDDQHVGRICNPAMGAIEDTAGPDCLQEPGDLEIELASDAGKLADICLRLRAETELKPAGDLWSRTQQRVGLYQESQMPAAKQAWEDLPDVGPDAAPEILFSDLFELCSGTLDDAQAGAVERRLASSPEAQQALRAAGKLSSVLAWLRTQSELRPDDQALARLRQRVSVYLDQQISQSADEWNESPRQRPAAFSPAASSSAATSSPAFPVLWDPQRETRTSQVAARQAVPSRWSRTRAVLALAACLLVALGIWHFMETPVASDRAVFAEIKQTENLQELRQLSSQLAVLVGEDLLSIEEIAPQELANRHLLADLARRGSRLEHLETAKFLIGNQFPIGQPGPAIKSGGPVASVDRHSPSGLRHSRAGGNPEYVSQDSFRSRPAGGTYLFASVAYASAGEADLSAGQWSPAQMSQALRDALRNQNYERILRLTAERSELNFRLLRAWALVAAGSDVPDARAETLVARLDAESNSLPLPAQVFLAGIQRSLGHPAIALERFEALVPRLPELAFHIGQLFDNELHDESRAFDWYSRLDPQAFKAFRDFGLAQTKITVLSDENFPTDLSRWDRSESGRASFSILPEKIGHVLHQTEITDLANVGWLVTGNPAWSDYQVQFDFRFDEVAVGDPEIGVFAYFRGEEESYRLAIGRESLGLRRRESRSWGGYESISWPKVEPRYPTLALGAWYSAKFRVENHQGETRLAAKVWPRGGHEPLDWLLVSNDTLGEPYRAGRVGLLISNCQASIAHFRVLGLSDPKSNSSK